MNNPLKSVLNISRRELPLALLMFTYFFLVITSFWILKPLKKGLFIQHYDKSGFNLMGWMLSAPQAELVAKVLNMFVAILAVIAFTWLVRRFRRQQLTFIFSAFFMLVYIVYIFIFNRSYGNYTVWSFYLFGDLFSTLMVATFFAFLNDSVTPDSAKRMYGIVGLGGVTGGVFGTSSVRALLKTIPDIATWLWICFGIAILIALVAALAGRIVKRNPPPEIGVKIESDPVQVEGNPAIEGARLAFKSRYLLAIVAIVGLYEIVSTLLDFQFTSTIAYYLDGDAIGRQFATMFTITNWVAMFVQFFMTSFIMTRLGLTAALLVLPVVVFAGSAAFITLPILWVGSFLNTVDNGFSYSINQSAKETLYVPTSRDEKYKAKAFIDMFVQRFSKALAVGISLLITTLFSDFESIRWLSLVTIVIIVIWVFAARFVGRKFKEMTD